MYKKIIDRLYALNPDNVKLGLDNISKLLYHLGNPHIKLNTIHIAGTNGKGSTAFFLNSIFNTAGYKTGVYLSPHLIDIRERITIGHKWIPGKRFIEITEYIFRIMEKEKLSATFFEFITAVAFLYFLQEKINIGIIEVGLGGRLDATNVLTPMVSIITEIGLDHTNYLGSSIKEIAMEKGGIIKDGGTVFISVENEEAVTAIKKISEKKRASCFQYGKDFVIDQHDEELTPNTKKLLFPQTFSLRFREHEFKKLEIKTAGTFQIKNSSTAVAVAFHLSNKYPAINEHCIREGLKNTRIPCRMELVQESPQSGRATTEWATAQLHNKNFDKPCISRSKRKNQTAPKKAQFYKFAVQVVLDVAHNFQAIQILIKNVPLFFTYNRLIVVLGILDDKDYKKIIKALSTAADTFIMTEPNTERALSARLLEKEASAFETETFIEKEIPKAISKAKEIADADDLILVTGSFYTVGEALSELS